MVEHVGSHKLSPPTPSLAQARVECMPQTKAPGREKPLPIMLHIFLGPGAARGMYFGNYVARESSRSEKADSTKNSLVGFSGSPIDLTQACC